MGGGGRRWEEEGKLAARPDPPNLTNGNAAPLVIQLKERKGLLDSVC